jgi:hypothetical protein
MNILRKRSRDDIDKAWSRVMEGENAKVLQELCSIMDLPHDDDGNAVLPEDKVRAYDNTQAYQ